MSLSFDERGCCVHTRLEFKYRAMNVFFAENIDMRAPVDETIFFCYQKYDDLASKIQMFLEFEIPPEI